MHRILREAAPVEGGGVEAPAPEPTPEPTPAPEPAKVTLTQDELVSLHRRLLAAEEKAAKADAEAKAKIESEQKAAIEKLAAEGKAKEAVELERARLQKQVDDLAAEIAGRDKAVAESALEAAVARAMAGRQFVSDFAKADAEARLRAKVRVEHDGGKAVVRDSASGRFASETLGGYLDTPEFAHLLSAPSKGGSGSRGGDKPAPDATPQDQPRNLGEALLRRLAEAREKGERLPTYFGFN